ncbi:hypothetical protein [Pseudidiomarina taiwanensis]|uniref:Toxin co-regulated pilus biosynthesis protein Q C-terminal domain-containing protein n=1 Tax=Pseudidiomarina taiwanensis TaxID=337250 RepID=A0A432ZK48_9GAMM|nr:hypothetical protein [Pseudidiomarina taiwanensis]RUO78264.1 hypothetical protein CWI83_04320 [Pseudidiomarina taiwanensis]
MVLKPTQGLTQVLVGVSSGLFLSLMSAPLQAQQCAPFAIAAAWQTLAASTPTPLSESKPAVSAELNQGLLQPQVEQLIRAHLEVDWIDWQISPHHRWPADMRLDAPSWGELLQRLLKPYGIQLTIYANRSARLSYRGAQS